MHLPRTTQAIFAALAIAAAASTAFASDAPEEAFTGKDEPSADELKSPMRIRHAILLRLDAVEQKLDEVLAKRDVPPEVAREVKIRYRAGAKLLKTSLQPMQSAPKTAPSKPTKARPTKVRRPRIDREPRPPSKSGRPGPAETGRAPNHRPR